MLAPKTNMQKITEEQLENLLEIEHCAVSLRADGGIAEIAPRMCVSIDFSNLSDGGNVTFKGYTVFYGERERTSKRFDTLVSFLRKIGAKQSGEYVLEKINDRHGSVDEYEAEKAFMALDGNGITDKYFPLADSFELVAPFCGYDEICDTCPEGRFKLSHNDGERALRAVKEQSKNMLRELYERELSEAQKEKLPPFEELCADIEKECGEHSLKAEEGALDEDESEFMCDLLSEGKVKYSEPHDVFWHFYSELGMLRRFERSVEILENNTEERALDYELEKEECAPLKNNLLSVIPTFSWHCTTSGLMHKVFRFTLNNDTAKWLKERYFGNSDESPFEDLAFYKGDKLLYSECTHEGFRNDFSNELSRVK